MNKPIAYILNDWENNGYYDSDFQYALWVPGREAVVMYEYGSTRYAGVTEHSYDFKTLTASSLAAARKFLEEGILTYLRNQEVKRVQGEVAFDQGNVVRLTKPVTFKDKRNLDADGKPTVVKAEAGETGTVIWAGHYSTFCSNRRDRDSLRIVIRFEDGQVVFCAAAKAVLVVNDEVPDDELMAEAHRLSFRYDFKGLVSSHSGWLTANPALEKAKELLGLDVPEAP